MSKSRGILFSAPMIRAIRRNVNPKTVTRRLVKLNYAGRVQLHGRQWHIDDPYAVLGCPYGQPGDILWVKETFCQGHAATIYRADCCEDRPIANTDDWNAPRVDRWSASIHMPRRLSRLTLEVVSVRPERLQSITEADAIAEGWEKQPERSQNPGVHYDAARDWYADLWDSINGDGSWASNPWVWRIEFRRIK